MESGKESTPDVSIEQNEVGWFGFVLFLIEWRHSIYTVEIRSSFI